MSEESESQRKYLAGYEAFEGGNFNRANELADACMAISPPASYWYAGALGLKCWVASFTHNQAALEQNAAALLDLDTGSDKPWFDGLALLNLGLAHRQDRHISEAQTLFLRAAERYAAQQLHPGQPAEWQKVLDYFNTLSRWGATEDSALWEDYLGQFSDDTGEDQSELSRQLASAARLMLRCSEGREVGQEALALVGGGVSRTFLVVVLLG